MKPASVDSLSLVRFDTNNYSVPVKYAHRQGTVVATVDEIRLVHEDRLIARHPRHWGREQYLFEPIHYLALLERKPGGFDFARPLENWNCPPASTRSGGGWSGTPTVSGCGSSSACCGCWSIPVLPQLTDAVEYALDLDITDADSIRVILEHRREEPVPLFSLDGRPHLKGVARRTDRRLGLPVPVGGGLSHDEPKTETKSLVLLEAPPQAAEAADDARPSARRWPSAAARENVDHSGFLLQLCELELIERERRAGGTSA